MSIKGTHMKAVIVRIQAFLDRHGNLSPLLLRLGLATVFLYASISSLLSPNDWIGYLPHVLTVFLPAKIMLTAFSFIELLLAAWLLSGVYVRWAALLSALLFGGIIISNVTLLPISFRDIGLLFAALALLVMKDDSADNLA